MRHSSSSTCACLVLCRSRTSSSCLCACLPLYLGSVVYLASEGLDGVLRSSLLIKVCASTHAPAHLHAHTHTHRISSCAQILLCSIIKSHHLHHHHQARTRTHTCTHKTRTPCRFDKSYASVQHACNPGYTRTRAQTPKIEAPLFEGTAGKVDVGITLDNLFRVALIKAGRCDWEECNGTQEQPSLAFFSNKQPPTHPHPPHPPSPPQPHTQCGTHVRGGGAV